MLEAITQSLIQAMDANLWLAPFAAFAGGLTTAANPCVLAMVPLMVAYVAGQETRSVWRSFLLSMAFSVGITLMFAILFLATWAASSVLHAEWWTYLAAVVCLLMGLHLLGLLHFEIPAQKQSRRSRRDLREPFFWDCFSALSHSLARAPFS